MTTAHAQAHPKATVNTTQSLYVACACWYTIQALCCGDTKKQTPFIYACTHVDMQTRHAHRHHELSFVYERSRLTHAAAGKPQWFPLALSTVITQPMEGYQEKIETRSRCDASHRQQKASPRQNVSPEQAPTVSSTRSDEGNPTHMRPYPAALSSALMPRASG